MGEDRQFKGAIPFSSKDRKLQTWIAGSNLLVPKHLLWWKDSMGVFGEAFVPCWPACVCIMPCRLLLSGWLLLNVIMAGQAVLLKQVSQCRSSICFY